MVNTLQYMLGSGSVPALDDAGGVVLGQVWSAEEYSVRLGTGVAINLTRWFHAMGTVDALNVPHADRHHHRAPWTLRSRAYLADAERFGVTTIVGAPPIFRAVRHPDLATRDLSIVRTLTGRRPATTEPAGTRQVRQSVAVDRGVLSRRRRFGAAGQRHRPLDRRERALTQVATCLSVRSR